MMTIYKQARQDIIERLQDGFNSCYADFHSEVFNSDYYIVGTHAAKKALEEFGVFDAIEKIQEYEQYNFGVINTDLGNPEKVVNMLYYIIGEEVLYGLVDGCEAWVEHWNTEATEESNRAVLAHIENK